MSLVDTSAFPHSFEKPPGANHVLVMDRGKTIMTLSDKLIEHESTSTFTRQLEHARQVLRELHPGHVLLGVEDGSPEELNLIKEAVDTGARVVVVGPAGADLLAQRSLSQGAVQYLTQPLDTDQLWAALGSGTKDNPRPAQTRVRIPRDKKPLVRCGTLLSQCSSMQYIVEQMQRVAPTSASVLITGESGTGKEVVAQAIHQQSKRRDKPFLPINCGAISPQLIESELFGHEKGSFTGAIREHQGVFERAHGGTLFLDEITEMPIDLQVKLLRVLEAQRFVRLGSDREQKSDVRIIAATNRCPEKEVDVGRLRPDLLYRIQVFPIWLPPLRERKGDVKLLAQHFLSELNQAEDCSKQFSVEALSALNDYHWPGNLRELKNVVQRTYIMAEELITAQDLPAHILHPSTSVRQRGPSLTVNIGTSVAEVEKNLIMATLDQCGGKKEKAAGILGVSVKTLYNRLREYEERTLGEAARREGEA